MGITGIASSGMAAAMAQFDATSQNIATAGAPGLVDARSVEAISTPLPDGGVRTNLVTAGGAADQTDGLITAMTASLSYRADASVIRAADAMIGTLIDMAG